eukprot:3135062-Prymnesium_polylepis.1
MRTRVANSLHLELSTHAVVGVIAVIWSARTALRGGRGRGHHGGKELYLSSCNLSTGAWRMT